MAGAVGARTMGWLGVVAVIAASTVVAQQGVFDAFDPVQKAAPNIAIETLNGEKVELSSLRGQPVVVHFWLPSCQVCGREFPELMAASRQVEGGAMAFLAVSLDPDLGSIQARAQQWGVDMPLLVARGEVLGPMHVAAAPSTVFIDKEGIIRAAVNGPRDRAFFRRRIQELHP